MGFELFPVKCVSYRICLFLDTMPNSCYTIFCISVCILIKRSDLSEPSKKAITHCHAFNRFTSDFYLGQLFPTQRDFKPFEQLAAPCSVWQPYCAGFLVGKWSDRRDPAQAHACSRIYGTWHSAFTLSTDSSKTQLFKLQSLSSLRSLCRKHR